MSKAHSKFDLHNRSLFERMFEPPAVGKMAPVARSRTSREPMAEIA